MVTYLWWRVATTLVLVVLWGSLSSFYAVTSPLITGPAAGLQFENSNSAYIASTYVARLFTGSLPVWPLLLAVLLVWIGPLIGLVRKALAGTALALLLSVAAFSPANAYYQKSDYAEPFFIGPNESAFWVPDVGANKDTQTAFLSEAYYRENKIPVKRFDIKHTVLPNSGYAAWANYVVPAGRLYLVDRTPTSREWVVAGRGSTTGKDESFPCQSSEGINITVGMAIAARVTEEDSPKFLYSFGIKPVAGDRNNPEVIFTSVYYSYSLADVMDGLVRNKVQTLVCNEFANRTTVRSNVEAVEIVKSAEKSVREYLVSVGITLDFLGWADTFAFDPAVQKAINDKFVAETVGPVLPVLQALADVKVKEGLGEGLSKHGLPANLLTLPTDLASGFATMLGQKK